MQTTYLEDLVKGCKKVSICVCVMRKWTHRDNMGKGKPIYTALVLADAKGNGMYAEIPAEQIEAKESLLDIDKIYNINKFRVSNAKTNYKPFDCHLMIEFTEFTEITTAKHAPDTFPAYFYRLTPISQATPRPETPLKFIDVLGYITRYEATRPIVPKGQDKGSILREIYIKDLDNNEIRVTIWGDQAQHFNINHLYDNTSGKIVVILFVGCLPREMKKKVNLSGGNACRYYLNPNIKEAQPFYSRFKDTAVYIDQPSPSEDQPLQPIPHSPLEHKTLAELNDIDPYDFAERGYKCTVTVTYIPDNNRWWYMACTTCNKKSELLPGGGYNCPNRHGSSTIPRYMLSFNTKDETDESNFFAFDELAARIIQRNCKAILNPLKLPVALPRQIQDIMSKKFTFGIGLTEDSFTSSARRQYLVNSVLERSDRPSSNIASCSTQTNTPVTTNPTNVPSLQESAAQPVILPANDTIVGTPPPLGDSDQTPSKHHRIPLSTPGTQTRRCLFQNTSSSENRKSVWITPMMQQRKPRMMIHSMPQKL